MASIELILALDNLSGELYLENKSFTTFEVTSSLDLALNTVAINTKNGSFLLKLASIGFQQLGQKWMVLKIIFVAFLTLYHFYLGSNLNKFKNDQNIHSHKFYRLINEIPTLLLILIVFVVIFKPL